MPERRDVVEEESRRFASPLRRTIELSERFGVVSRLFIGTAEVEPGQPEVEYLL